MAEQPVSVRETRHIGFGWTVETQVITPAVPGVPPQTVKMLKFGNYAETEFDSYPMTLQMAAEIGRALAATPIATASEQAVASQLGDLRRPRG